jgi:hypothetical protein
MKLLRNQNWKTIKKLLNFITDKSKNSITPNKIEVSKYLIGFAADFKTKGCNRFFKLV